MAIALGNVASGSAYTARFDAADTNKKLATLLVTWASDDPTKTTTTQVQIAPGGSGQDARNCPAGDPEFETLEIRVALASGDTGTLTFTGLLPPNPAQTVRPVAATTDYEANIV